jgi:hypothetical protein
VDTVIVEHDKDGSKVTVVPADTLPITSRREPEPESSQLVTTGDTTVTDDVAE